MTLLVGVLIGIPIGAVLLTAWEIWRWARMETATAQLND